MRRLLSIATLAVVLGSGAAYADYRFERMWPTLAQPWYFNGGEGLVTDRANNIYIADGENDRIVKLTRDGRIILSWNTAGWPAGIAIDDDERLYVVTRDGNKVQVFSTAGDALFEFGAAGSGDGQFDQASDVALDVARNIYIADRKNCRVQVFDAAGAFLRKFGSCGGGDGQFPAVPDGWVQRFGIAVDTDGNVYVSDRENSFIQKFDSSGAFLVKWGRDGTGTTESWWPRGLLIGRDGQLHVAGQLTGDIRTFSRSGQLLATRPLNGGGRPWIQPEHLSELANGNLLISYLNGINEITAAGAYVARFSAVGNGAGEFHEPNGIVVDGAGNQYVLDRYNGRIQRRAAAGTGWEVFISNVPQGYDLARDGSGNLYVVSDGSIAKYSAAGSLLNTFDLDPVDGYAIAVKSDGSKIYVVDRAAREVHRYSSAGALETSWGSQGSANGQFNNPQGIALDSNGNVYVADSYNHRIQKFNADGVFQAKWGQFGSGNGDLKTPHGITIEGNDAIYVTEWDGNRIQIFNTGGVFQAALGRFGYEAGALNIPSRAGIDPNDGRVYVSEFGNNRVQAFRSVISSGNSKAIVVAGGGPFPGNALWDATQAMASFAYRTLVFQGFTKDTIQYLSADTDLDLDGNGLADDVDADATRATLEDAITNWAADAEELIVYITDHGGSDQFRVSGSETVASSELDAWLDVLQTAMGQDGRIVLIYDACQSGGFVVPNAATNRIIMSASAFDEPAYFTGQGLLSFSNFFWTQIFNGRSLGEAYSAARTAVEGGSTPQHPQLNADADGDGDANDADDLTVLNNRFIGSATDFFLDRPTIASVSGPQNISGTATATLEAFGVNDADGVARVWAVLNPPGFAGGSTDNPVTEMPTVDLVETSPGSGNYTASYTGFTIPGTWQIAIYALDALSNTSTPQLTSVTVGTPLTRRAILVAGGEVTDPGWPGYELALQSAWNALRFQGYRASEIAVLSASTTGGIGTELLNSLSNLSFALAASGHGDSQDVVVYLVGGFGTSGFALNDSEFVGFAQLDDWLDDILAVIPGTVTVIADGDNAGAYLAALTPPPGAAERLIRIASTTGTGPALFAQDGALSFSRSFWPPIGNGAYLRDAFIGARNALQVASGAAQRGRLDADSDGDSDKFDLASVREFALGAGILLAGDAPLVGTVNAPVELSGGGTSATLFAEDVTTTGTIASVFAVITPPVAPGQSPALPLPTVTLSPVGGGRYEASYNGFGPVSGVYQVSIFAEDDDGVLSDPAQTQVTQRDGPDVFEDDDAFADATVIVPNAIGAQAHTIHEPDIPEDTDPPDVDWVKFYGIAGEPYDIKVDNVGANADLAIDLFDSDGVTSLLFEPTDDDFAGGSELLAFAAPHDGLFYVRIYDSAGGGGNGTGYELRVDRPIAPSLGTIQGLVLSDLGAAQLGNALVLAGDDGSGLILDDASFEVRVSAGTVTLVILIPGRDPIVIAGLDVVAGETTEVVASTLDDDGDADGDGVPNAEDAFPNDLSESVDTDGDGIGNNADTDDDNDGVPDVSDLFPLNQAESADNDGDGTGDNADPDDDNDTVPDTQDAFPFDATESQDTDRDGIGNNADPDDDNDGVSDVDEIAAGRNPLVNEAVIPIIIDILGND